MVELAHRLPDAQGLERRALDQAAREVMLAQASDWAFIMKTGTTVPYATKRTTEHVKRFTRIYEGLVNGHPIDEAWLTEVMQRDNPFPEVDYHLYGT
jgi:1,4-alpha-glucan branching enzyme